MTFEALLLQFNNAKPLKLIRAKSAPLMLSFFYKIFKDAHITSITNSELRSKLEYYLEELDYTEKDDDLQAESLFDDHSLKAAQYIENWSNAGYLRKYPNDDGEDLHELTSDTQKVMKWIDDLQQKEFIGTNSRFKDIFFKLQTMMEKANENVEQRIEELKKKKWEIENEINLLLNGQKPMIADDTEIKEQFFELNKMARELLSDFTEVEQNFEQIRKDIQIKYTDKNLIKGDIAGYVLDGTDEINNKPQGKSFNAFWEFLNDDKMRAKFLELTDKMYQLLNERSIDYNNDKFLKKFNRFLAVFGSKVVTANRKLDEKLSRILSEKNVLERRKAIELIGEIKQMAHSISDARIKENDFIIIEDEPLIELIDRYELSEDKDEIKDVLFPDGIGGNQTDEVDLTMLFNQFTIDKKKLIQQIGKMLESKTQVTLKEVVDYYGLKNGLSEVIGYFSIATENSHHIIFEETIDAIEINNKRINIPMIIYTKAAQENGTKF